MKCVTKHTHALSTSNFQLTAHLQAEIGAMHSNLPLSE